jgi:tetratricopeptide (TPR) repeat protein
MKLSMITGISSNRLAAVSGKVPSRPSWRIRALVGLLLLLACAYPVILYRMHARPAPPLNASLSVKLRHYEARIAQDPSDIDAYLALGRLEEENGYFMAAVRRLTQARALGAPEREVAGPLGRALLRLARYEEARVELEKAARLAPDSVEAAVNLAGWYNDYGQADGARQALRAFVKNHPAYIAPPHLASLPLPSGATDRVARPDLERLVFCCAEIGDREQTLQLAERLMQVAPDAPTGYAVAGKILLEQNRPREAHERLVRALALAPNQAALHFYNGVALATLGDHRAALDEWLHAVTLNHNLPVAYYWIGGEYARRKRWRLAGIGYAQAAVLNNYDLRACRLAALMFGRSGSRLDAAYWEGTAAGVSGDYRKQRAAFLKILNLPGPLARRIGLRGVTAAYRGLQKPREYLQSMRRLATRDTDNDAMLLAEAYGDIDRFPTQVLYLRKAMARNPARAAEIHYRLGLIAKQLGQLDAAEAEMQQTLRLEPTNSACRRDLADLYFERRTVADRLRRAQGEYQTVVDQNPDSSEDWQHLGMAYLAGGDLSRAARCLEHAIDLQPGNGAGYQALGQVYMQMGDRVGGAAMLGQYRRYVTFTEMEHTLKTRAQGARRNPDAQIALADFLARGGDLDTAAERYALALQVRPDDPSTRRKLARIYGRAGRTDLQFDLERAAPLSKSGERSGERL